MREQEIKELRSEINHHLDYADYVEAKVAANETPLLWAEDWEVEQ